MPNYSSPNVFSWVRSDPADTTIRSVHACGDLQYTHQSYRHFDLKSVGSYLHLPGCESWIRHERPFEKEAHRVTFRCGYHLLRNSMELQLTESVKVSAVKQMSSLDTEAIIKDMSTKKSLILLNGSGFLASCISMAGIYWCYKWQVVRRIINGRGDRIRTCDPLVPHQMRYQTAPLPD